MKIIVQFLEQKLGKNLMLECEPSETIQNIKKKIELQVNLSLEGFCLKINQQYAEDEQTLSSCLNENSQVCVIRVFKKAIGGGGIGFEFNSMENSIQKDYSLDAGEQNIIVDGLNVDSECQNTSCKFYNQKVTVQLGIGTFNMVDLCFSENYLCCVCKQKPQDLFQNPIMNNCKYEISGRYLPDGKKNYEIFKKSGEIVKQYIVFEDAQNEKRLWHSLIVKTERLCLTHQKCIEEKI
ncbi:hypothetical protein ABPG74_011629 [Tetrahymena malaccensis]